MRRFKIRIGSVGQEDELRKTHSDSWIGWKVHYLRQDDFLLHRLWSKQTEDEAEAACKEGGSEESHGM